MSNSAPIAIDLFCGLGGWSEALLAEGYYPVGFDIERHVYEGHRYPAQLVIQDVLTIHGLQFKDAALIVASPPCQFFSYCAMPWGRSKRLAAEVRADPVRLAKELALFNACFRIQREACEAAGRHIPLIVENVRGAEPWVGRARASFGSFLLWGDVPALMPVAHKARKVPGFRFDGSGRSFQSASVAEAGIKADEGGRKVGGDWFSLADTRARNDIGSSASGMKILTEEDTRRHRSAKRKFASAMIAKIPETLARHIARTFRPEGAS